MRLLVLAALALALMIPTVAIAANPDFPGVNPDESVRANTPDDPAFDRCEPDNPGGATCTNVFDQDLERFGFAPNASQATATYLDPDPPTRQVQQNTAAGRNALGQVSGVSADRAWKYFGQAGNGPVGDPDVEVAILDTGIRWNRSELRTKVALNEGELPRPKQAGGADCGSDDCNGDGSFNVADFAGDPRVGPADGHPEADSFLDASDLLTAFSDGSDADGNGFFDDIAGWDFFDDDNDPYDASSYSAASNHGSGRAEEAGAETNNADSGTGLCPACQIVPIRVWDTFVVDTNQFALGVMYAADNDVEIVEGAVGGLLNSRFARETFDYAYERGTLPVIVSSDLNTADHNYPTNYDQALHIQGSVADTQGLGENPPGQLVDFLNNLPGSPPFGTNAPVSTWFRNSGTTQYGGHAHLVMPAVTGSAATGQASGAAALISSFGNRQGVELEPNEIKQLMTLTSEDVRAANTAPASGTPDPAQDGWEQHFGYGRLDLGAAIEAVRDDEIPPQALITSPDWFAPLNVAEQGSVSVSAQLSAERSSGYGWELQWAPGLEPCEADFQTIATGNRANPLDGELGSIDLTAVRAALDARTTTSACGEGTSPKPASGGSTFDPTAPAPGPGDVDPNEPAFTVRVQVRDAANVLGEDRKVLFAYEDETLREGWSRPIGGTQDASGESESGGESSHRMYDLDGDNRLEIVEATSSGTLGVFEANGTPAQSFNGGDPVRTRPYFNVHGGSAGFSDVDPPNEALRVPAIGDIDGDREPEIVDSAGRRVYAWEADGSEVAGFPVAIDPAHSQKADIDRANHVKRGFFAAPALGDLDDDGDLEIAIPGLDQYLYVYDGDGELVPNFPVYLRERDGSGEPIACSSDFECAESINTPAIGDIDGDEVPDIVVPTNEFDDDPSAPGAPSSLGDFSGGVTNLLENALGGTSRVYAVGADGEFLDGWPITVGGILPDVLPLVGPGVDHALADLDGDPELEVIGNVASGDVRASDGNGDEIAGYDSQPGGGEHVDKSKILNLFENPIVANLDGSGDLEVLKGGQTLNGLVNLGILVGQNLPYNHVLQAWNAADGTSLPAFPQAVEDYQLLSSPAVADVSDAAGNEAIVGTGLYLIRNINSTGVEGREWPKFTGGWNYAVPAVGDVDGDGTLEVAAQTREGFAFMWETGADACGGGNDEWWTSRHDEWNTGAYTTDSRPPGKPRALAAEREGGRSVRLQWRAPGDDWLCGATGRFQVRLSDTPLDGPRDGTPLKTLQRDREPGQRQGVTLRPGELGDARYAGIVYRDDAGNWGTIASVELPELPEPPGPPGGPNLGCSDRETVGTNGADELTGGPFGDRLVGRAGGDEIRGGGGADCLIGNRGPDSVAGQGGGDLIKGGQGRDRVRGGAGPDRVRGNLGRDVVAGFRGADSLRGGFGPDQIKGGRGRDSINVRGGGVDVVNCGKGRDTVRAGRRDEIRGSCERVRR